jgi:acyl-CoA reductase-like NAD-dependent aldehyde dehydrogenase
MERFVPMVATLKLGDPLDESTQVSALIDESEAKRVKEWMDEAVAAGAHLLRGGQREGNRVAPAILTQVPSWCKISAEEAFGPVTVVTVYDKFEQALDIVNSWKFGLQTGVFTNDLTKAMLAFSRLDVGGVIIGDIPTFRVDNYPYGGLKQSGFGREGVRYAMEEMSELKTLVLPAPR